jgi:hypothetical protein
VNLEASINSLPDLCACHSTHLAKMLRIAGFLMLLAVSTAGFALKDNKGVGPNECKVSGEEAADLNVDASTDVEALHRYQNGVARMLREEEFEKLDCLADHARSERDFPEERGNFICCTQVCIFRLNIRSMLHKRTGLFFSSISGAG